MQSVLKWTGIVVLALVLLLLATAVFAFARTRALASRTIDLNVGAEAQAVLAARSEGAVRRGARIASYRGCLSCHGGDLGGKVALDHPLFGRISASNLTSGRGGVAGSYTTEDWVRALRHGVAPDGRPLIMMPSHEYFPLSDGDTADLLAYIESLEPVDRALEPDRLGPLAYVFVGLGLLPFPADQIEDHAARPEAPDRGPTAEYGGYLALTCIGCHGEDLAGGMEPGAEMAAANLTPHADGLGDWSFDDFARALRTGTRPDGETVSEAMPWQYYSIFDEDELAALWAYLQTLPPREGN